MTFHILRAPAVIWPRASPTEGLWIIDVFIVKVDSGEMLKRGRQTIFLFQNASNRQAAYLLYHNLLSFFIFKQNYEIRSSVFFVLNVGPQQKQCSISMEIAYSLALFLSFSIIQEFWKYC